MPELPEVETTLRGLEPHITGKTVAKVICRHHQLRWPIPMCLDDVLAQQSIKSLSRRGKYLLFHFARGTMLVHLGMTGRFSLLSESKPAHKHDHVDIIFTNGWCLRYSDPRRFGAIIWTMEELATLSLLRQLGSEPLSSKFTPDYLWQATRARQTPIKPLLMSNKIVVGVGNIYATEALYIAQVHPNMPACKLSHAQAKDLVQAIQDVLTSAIAAGGTTLKDFVDSHGKPGYFIQQLQAYGRAGLRCNRCHTILSSMQLGQRTTVFCSKCQSY